MQRYFIYLAYDGTNYHGWQVQPNAVSVQEEIQISMSKVMRRNVEIVGAGRTDTGVHARFMVAHFDSESLLDGGWLTQKLNRMLPVDISIYKVVPVVATAHARFSAIARTYHYFVHTQKSPFERHFSWRPRFILDFDKMNEAAQYLLAVTDFTSFSKLHTDTKTNNCKVEKALWEQVGEDSWRFEITADRFLRNMVRAVVGTLMEVGRGNMSLEAFCQVVKKNDRCSAGESVPGHALFLVDIRYPKVEIPDLFLEDDSSRFSGVPANTDFY
ncbi:MAG: tRNA pseudouridine(38-40) synthase TruA [Bacteroidaceae bacterium]